MSTFINHFKLIYNSSSCERRCLWKGYGLQLQHCQKWCSTLIWIFAHFAVSRPMRWRAFRRMMSLWHMTSQAVIDITWFHKLSLTSNFTSRHWLHHVNCQGTYSLQKALSASGECVHNPPAKTDCETNWRWRRSVPRRSPQIIRLVANWWIQSHWYIHLTNKCLLLTSRVANKKALSKAMKVLVRWNPALQFKATTSPGELNNFLAMFSALKCESTWEVNWQPKEKCIDWH